MFFYVVSQENDNQIQKLTKYASSIAKASILDLATRITAHKTGKPFNQPVKGALVPARTNAAVAAIGPECPPQKGLRMGKGLHAESEIYQTPRRA